MSRHVRPQNTKNFQLLLFTSSHFSLNLTHVYFYRCSLLQKVPLCTQTKSNLNFCVNFFFKNFRLEKKLLNVNLSVFVANSTELELWWSNRWKWNLFWWKSSLIKKCISANKETLLNNLKYIDVLNLRLCICLNMLVFVNWWKIEYNLNLIVLLINMG